MPDDERLKILINRCAEARKLYEQNEIDYYEFLFSVQESERDTWSIFATFETFIERCVGRPNPAKWTRYVLARERVGLDEIRRVGIPSILNAIDIADDKARRAYLEEQAEWSRQHNGVHASEQYAKAARERIDPRPERATPAINRLREVEELRAENSELRRECARLKKENVKLRERVGQLEASVDTPKRSARKATPKTAESHAT